MIPIRKFFLRNHYGSLLFLAGCALGLLQACQDSDPDIVPEYRITVSETGNRDQPVDELELSADGGKDTLFVFASTEVSVHINESVEWLTVVDQHYDENRKATVVIIEAEKMLDDLTQRLGEVDVISEEAYGRRFIVVRQGYKAHFSGDFSWLHYGHGNPLQLDEGVLMDDWNPTQKEYGWLSGMPEGSEKAVIYGKDGYLQLGSDQAGGTLSTPILSGLQNDSLMELTFNAVGFKSMDSGADQSNLTLHISGGTFEDGKTEKVIQVGFIDPESALVATHMWENTAYQFVLRKPADDPYSTTVQVTFIGGTKTPAAHNRIFLDNVRVFFKAPYSVVPEENTQ